MLFELLPVSMSIIFIVDDNSYFSPFISIIKLFLFFATNGSPNILSIPTFPNLYLRINSLSIIIF